MQQHFNNQHGGADFSGHDVKSLIAKTIRFELQGILLKLGFIPAEKPLLMASYHVDCGEQHSQIQEAPYNCWCNDIAMCITNDKIVLEKEASKKLK